MELLRPVLLFLAGAVGATAVFLSGVDRHLPAWMGIREEPLAVAIDAPSSPGDDGCQLTYAIDNRTHHKLLLTVNTPPRHHHHHSRGWDPDGQAPDYGADPSGDDSGVSIPQSEPVAAPADEYYSGDDENNVLSANDRQQPFIDEPAEPFADQPDEGQPPQYATQPSYREQNAYRPPQNYGPAPGAGRDADRADPFPDRYGADGTDQQTEAIPLLPPARGVGPREIRPGRLFFASDAGEPEGSDCNGPAHTVRIALHG